MKKIQSTHARQDASVADSQAIFATADAGGRDLTVAERKRIKANADNFRKAGAIIDLRKTLDDQEAELRRRPRVKAVARGRVP